MRLHFVILTDREALHSVCALVNSHRGYALDPDSCRHKRYSSAKDAWGPPPWPYRSLSVLA